MEFSLLMVYVGAFKGFVRGEGNWKGFLKLESRGLIKSLIF